MPDPVRLTHGRDAAGFWVRVDAGALCVYRGFARTWKAAHVQRRAARRIARRCRTRGVPAERESGVE